MKVKLLVDTMVSIKGGTVIDIDEKQYTILKRMNRCIAFEDEPKKETTVVKPVEKRKKGKK